MWLQGGRRRKGQEKRKPHERQQVRRASQICIRTHLKTEDKREMEGLS